MRVSKLRFCGAAAIALLALPQAAGAAPRPWLLPSETTFTGSGDEWVTVDAAISTDLYYPDHPGQDWRPVATAPDGSSVEVENLTKGKLRETFDLHVTKRGTWKIAVASEAVMGSYLLDGERKMLPRGTTPATLAGAVPAGASDVRSAVAGTRIETFLTAGQPDTGAFKPSGKGLEMVPVTNPTDLAVGERATFQFLLDGKPAAALPVSVVNGGVRYADKLEQLSLTTGADGKVTIDWPSPGMWWVSVTNGAMRMEGGGPRPAGAPGGPGGAPGSASGGERADGPSPRAAGPDVGGPGAGRPGGEGGPGRFMLNPQRRDTYAMTVQVLG